MKSQIRRSKWSGSLKAAFRRTGGTSHKRRQAQRFAQLVLDRKGGQN